MAHKVTIKDIAEKTGTSVTSVHRALYGSKGISDSLRKKILREVEHSNYRMDEAASMLRRGQFNITVLLPKPEAEERFYYRGLWDGIYRGAEEIKKNKVNIRFVETTHGVNQISRALENLFDEEDENLHGLITICDDEAARDWIQRFIRRGTKVALIDRGIEIENLSCCVETSSQDMGDLAVNMMDFLVPHEETGIIVLINGPEHRLSYRIYRQAVSEKMSELHLNQELVVINGYEEGEGRRQLSKLFKEKKVCGIISSCARTTYWACDMVDKLQLENTPPIVGTDVFQELQPYFEKGILKASIYQSHREHGEKALKYLYECLSNPHMVCGKQMPGALSLVLKENYKYFL